jgi:hypothetical protein
MKKCTCNSTEFHISGKVQVKYILNGNLEVIGTEIRNPRFISHLNGLIICSECGKQYTEDGFKELLDV